MRPPMIAATRFLSDDPAVDARYARLARVLTSSAAQHCGTWIRSVETVAAPPTPHYERAWAANTLKATRWHAIVDAAADGDRVLLVDVDTMILRPLDDLWDRPFDLAYTVKDRARYPVNTGVVAVRVSPAVRAVFDVWRLECQRMLDDPRHHQIYRRQYGGIHQAALGCLFEHGVLGNLQTRPLPCLEWNCEDTSWAHYDPAVTRIVHIKSALRRAIVGVGPTATPTLKPLIATWRQLERAAQAAEDTPPCPSR